MTPHHIKKAFLALPLWVIGYLIVEHEQQGQNRAEYGKALLKGLSKSLTSEFGKDFDTSNLRYMRLVYLAFPNRDSLRQELSWTHYRLLSCNEKQPASKYITELPSEEKIRLELERERVIIQEQLVKSHQKE